MTAIINPPADFVPGNTPATSWATWKENYLLYELATGFSSKTLPEKRALFLHCLGQYGRDIYKTFSVTETDVAPTVATIMGKFTELYKPYKNSTQAAFVFTSLRQQPNQIIDDFIATVKRQAQECEFGDSFDRMVSDRIIFGITDSALRERLLRDSPLTLVNIVKACKSAEISKQHARQIDNHTTASCSALNVQKRGKFDNKKKTKNFSAANQQNQQNKSAATQQAATAQPKQCSRCGLSHKPRNCPAYGQHCRKCGIFGHYAKMCRQTQRRQLGELNEVQPTDETSQSEDLAFLGELIASTESATFYVSNLNLNATLCDDEETEWLSPLLVNGLHIVIKLDTGSQVNVLPDNIFTALKGATLQPTQIKVATYTGEKLAVKGQSIIRCQVPGTNAILDLLFVIVNSKTRSILSAVACKKLGLLVRNYPANEINILSTNVSANNEEFSTIIGEFQDVFTGIGQLPGVYKLTLKPGAEPYIAPPRKVPQAIELQFKDTLDSMEDQKIIAKVTKPVKWAHPFVIVHKKNGHLRVCLDPRRLNPMLQRSPAYIPTNEEQFVKLQAGATVFSLFDASNGFWHLTLDEKSAEICTFATPWGYYRFLRLPPGLAVAPDLFQSAMSQLFINEPDMNPYFDDILLAATNVSQHKEQIIRLLTIARKNNLKLNKAKTVIGVPQVQYLGHVISAQGIAPDPNKVKAIVSFSPPANRQELTQFLGMATYLMKFVPNFSDKTHHLRQLLKHDMWVWSPTEDQCFQEVKQALTTAPVLAHFDNSKPITISTDASSFGLGSVLLQEQHPVAYASAALTDTQQRIYAQIEKELLAIVFACERFHYYIYSRPVTVETDHKPLISIVEKPYQNVSPRLQRYLLRLQRYIVKLVYVPGKQLVVADTLSRFPTTDTYTDLDEEVPLTLCLLATATDEKWVQIRQATADDLQLQQVSAYIKNGWPSNSKDVNSLAQPFFHCKFELHVTDGLVCRGDRLVMPFVLQKETLAKLHETHRGLNACKSKARQALFWPTLNNDVDNMIANCAICQQYQRNNQAEPLLCHPIPARPWQMLRMDFFHLQGNTYLLVIDYFSKYIELQLMNKTTNAATVINCLKSILARHGLPEEILSDGGPPFDSSELQKYMQQQKIKHTLCSPYHHKSNGQVERAVQTMKNSLIKAAADKIDLYSVLLDYRVTPVLGSWSPSELLMGRKLQTPLPVLPSNLQPKYDITEPMNVLQQNRAQQEKYGNVGTKPLQPLILNQKVWMKKNPEAKEWTPATVIQIGPEPRSYVVRTNNGATYRRNRFLLKPVTGDVNHSTSKAEDYYPVIQPSVPPLVQPGNIQQPIQNPRNIQQQPIPTVATDSQHVTRLAAGKTINPPQRYQRDQN